LILLPHHSPVYTQVPLLLYHHHHDITITTIRIILSLDSTPHISENMQYLAFWTWPILFNIISSSIHFLANDNFITLYGWIILHGAYIFFLYPFIGCWAPRLIPWFVVFHYFIYLINFFCVWGILGLELRAYTLCYFTGPFLWWVFFFEIRFLELFAWVARATIFLISASWITKIIAMSHPCLTFSFINY
jgi:hypothetical protein